MKNNFLRLLALLVAVLAVVCLIPVFAAETDIVVTIPFLEEGASFPEGVDIPLMVDYNSDTSTISHVDFYADDVKIPGNIPEGNKGRVLMWSKPMPGSYKVKAKICYVGGGVAESEPVTISVLPSGEYVDVSRFGDAELSLWKLGAGQASVTEDMLSTEYADFSNKTFLVENAEDLEALRIFKGMNTKDYRYVNVLVHHFKNDRYNEATGYTYVPQFRYTLWREGNDLSNKPEGTWNQYSGPLYNTNEGWNRITLVNGNMNFNSVIYGITNYPRNDEKGKVGYGVAIAGVFLSNTLSETMTATPLIPDGQKNVSYTMPGYRLTFNRPFNDYMTKEKLSAVTMTLDDNPSQVVPVTYSWGEEYLELKPTKNLLLNKTYRVTIPANTLCDNYGNFVSAQTFTFSTSAISCAKADSIPYVTYPAQGALVASEGLQLAAKILFPVDDTSDVKFYDNGTEIKGEVTRGTGSEFVMNNVSLTPGEHTVTVRATKGDRVFDSQNSVSFTVISADTYEVIGLRGNVRERIILNPGRSGYSDFSHKVTIVDHAQIAQKDDGTIVMENGHSLTKFYLQPTATGISQVIFDLDGVKTIDKTYPYEFPLNTEHSGTHTLTATIFTTDGAVITKTIPFEGIIGSVAHFIETSYDTYNEAEMPFIGSSAWVAASYDVSGRRIALNHAQSRNNASTGSTNVDNSIWLKPESETPLPLGDTKLAYVDFDIQKRTEDVEFQFGVEPSRASSNGGSSSNIKCKNGSENAFVTTDKIHITIAADFQNGHLSAYANGVQFNSITSDLMKNGASIIDRLKLYNFDEGETVYIDNFSIRSYSVAENFSYGISGIRENDTLFADELGYKQTVFAHVAGDTGSTAGLSQAVFKLNGTTIGTATAAPFSCDIPLMVLGPQSLTVEMTDSEGEVTTVTVPYTVHFRSNDGVATDLITDSHGVLSNKVTVANPGDDSAYILFTAIYNDDDTLKRIDMEEIPIRANEIKMHEVVPGQGEKVKLFAWTLGLRPID